ncbi:MAG: hypothetical protein RLZZ144_374 [Pseudomonadota bacterium]
MNLNHRTLLFFCADQLQAHAWSNGYLLHLQDFTHDALGHQQFAKFLVQHSQPILILVDVIEEDFRHEHLPRLNRRHRAAFSHRKLEQYYPHTIFRQSQWTRHTRDGRSEHALLLSALNQPAKLTPWLEILRAHHHPLIAIQSVPHLGAELIKSLSKSHLLLLSWNRTSGLRQSFYIDGQLHVSRLIPLTGNLTFSEAINVEMPRMLHYLSSQNLPPAGINLQVTIICHAEDQASLKLSLTAMPELPFEFLDLQSLGSALPTKKTYLDSDATPLFLQTLASQALRQHYAPAHHTRIYRLWKMRLTMLIASGFLLLLSATGMAYQFLQARAAQQSATKLDTQSIALTQKASALKLLFPANVVPGDDMQKAVLMSQQLSQISPAPLTVLAGLSHLLEDYPRIKLRSLSWKNAAASATLPQGSTHLITLEGELLDFADDYRATLNYLTDFQQALSANGYRINAQSPPIDVSASGQLSDIIFAQRSTKFTLELSWGEP